VTGKRKVTSTHPEFRYPRRRLARALLRRLSAVILTVMTDLRVVGRENLPKEGPLLVVGNHFAHLDPVAMVRVLPWPLEFIGGLRTPFAPSGTDWIPGLWGYYRAFRGGVSLGALRAAEAVLTQGGVLGIFPEGGAWAAVLRPARPGVAFLAVRTGALILPMGFVGFTAVLPHLRRGRRARVTVRIGRPCGPFHATGRGRARRRQLDAISHEIMQRIAELIPAERRGYYSDDPAICAAARASAIYPWADSPER
jgi:1-acyl-sn-glycerol-3-phosphate acyltransferase